MLPWLAILVETTEGAALWGGNPEQQLAELGTPDALELLFALWAQGSDPDGQAQLHLELAGWKSFAVLLERGHTRACELLHTLAKKSPTGTRKDLAKAIGKRRADALLAGSATTLDTASILAVLDAAAKRTKGDNLSWPSFASGVGHFEYHAMRVIAARAREGDDWGLLFEVVQGDAQGRDVRWPATIQLYRYGSRIADSGGGYLVHTRKLVVPKGKGTLVERVRAALAKNHRAFWNPAAKAAACLDLGARPQILVDSDAFAHVVGKQGGKPATLPSKSTTYRSIAEALVTRDAEVFEPGTPNTSWQLHARPR
jgi:hypothetical protein